MTEKQAKIQNILAEKGAKLEYKGKSKDVYGLPNGNVLMVFGDGFTGANGVADPGANRNIGTMDGLGHRNLEVSSWLFDEIAKNLQIATHQVSVDLENDILEAKRVSTLGKGLGFNFGGKNYIADGAEIIGRNDARGTFLNRNPDIMKAENLTDKDGAFIEFSLKSDEANDPFVSPEQLIESGVITKDEKDFLIKNSQKIIAFLTKLFGEAGMQLLDIKIEFGRDNDGNLILADEISPGSLRVAVNGQEYPDKAKIYEKLMDYKKSLAPKTPDPKFKAINIASPEKKQPLVGIYMGSDSDLKIMSNAAKILKRFGIPYEIDITSAHRTPEKMRETALAAEERGLKVIIAGAGGGAAHLPGMIASYTALPVIGVPIGEKSVSSVLMMPGGVPVACVKADEAHNAGILAAQIIGSSDPIIRERVKKFKQEMVNENEIKSGNLKRLGFQSYLEEFGK